MSHLKFLGMSGQSSTVGQARKALKRIAVRYMMLGGALCAASAAAYAQAALTQTIDLKTWSGVPVTIVQPPPPVPAPGFSLTSMAFDPVINTIYVADYATTNVYQIDASSNTVTSAVYTNGLFNTSDIGATQNLPGTAPKVVLANPANNRWIFMGQGGGAEFSGTTFAEAVNARSFQSGGAWDPVTDNVYGADGLEFFAVNNLKFLYAGVGACNSVAVNRMTQRVYVGCGGGIVVFDGITLSKASVKIPTAALAGVPLGHPVGLAVNPNTNRLFVVGGTSPNSMDVLDASTYQVLTSIPGLPDQSADFLVAGYLAMPLPRPIVVNTLTNTIYVINSVSSTISVIDGRTNTLTGTINIPVPNGAVVSQPYQAGTQLAETKPGNTIYDASTGMITTLGGAIAAVVNEAANTLYVAGVNGTISVFTLAPPTAAAAFSVNGVIQDPQGVPVAGVLVKAGNATAITDATGLFVITGLPAGTYAITPASPLFSFAPASQSLSVLDRNLSGLTFQANPPIVPASYALSPWTMIGAGVTTTGTVTLNQPAPAGGAVLTLSVSDPKAVKVPSTVTVPAGQSSITFLVQGSGVSAMETVSLNAQYNGGTATTSVAVAPGDKLNITAATYSKSTHTLTVNATDSSALPTLNVYLASNNQLLGTMINQGGGSYSFQVSFPNGTPASISVVSNLGAKTGQGVSLVP